MAMTLRSTLVLLGALVALPVVSHSGLSADDSTDPAAQRDQAMAALSAAKSSVSEFAVRLNKTNDELSGQYRILGSDTYRRDREQQAKSRSEIRRLQTQRNELWAARDLAQLVLLQREAEFEAADSRVRVHELQAAGAADPAEIQKWQKRQEKAQARALKLQRQVEVAEKNANN